MMKSSHAVDATRCRRVRDLARTPTRVLVALAASIVLLGVTPANAAAPISAGSRLDQVNGRTATPVMYSCTGKALRRPKTFNIACGDGNGLYARMHWPHWGNRYAAGRGRQWYNTCKPYCAAGNYKVYRVRVRLHRVRSDADQRYFARMKVYRPARAPHRQDFPLPAQG
jgi:hypothetical protein